MHHRLFAIVLTVLMCAATLASAQLRQFGNVIYDTPEGWETAGTTDGRHILRSLPGPGRCPECQIVIGAGAPRADDFETLLATGGAELMPGAGGADAAPLGAPVYFLLHGRETALTAATAGGRLNVFAVIALPDRYQTFGFSGDAATAAAFDQSMAAFENEFSVFLGRVGFVTEGRAALMPAAVPGAMQGLWWGTAQAGVLGEDGLMQMQVRHTRLVFWKEGYVYLGQPPQGLAVPDLTDAATAADPRLGVYTRQGNRLLLTFADGRREDLGLRGTTLLRRGGPLHPVTPLADGERLAGRLLLMPAPEGDGHDTAPPAPVTVEFERNGRYRGRVLGEVDVASAGATAAMGQLTGRYAVRDGLVTLTPDDGARPTMALGFRSGEDVLIGTAVLDRQAGADTPAAPGSASVMNTELGSGP